MPILTVRRDTAWRDRLRRYRILLDAVEIGRLRHGEFLQHEVAAGEHVLEARIDWCSSEPLVFEADADAVDIEVRSSLRGLGLLLAVYYISLGRQNYLTLERIG